MKKMKIVVTNTTPSIRELYYHLAKELMNMGFRVEFVTLSIGTEKYMMQRDIPVYNIEKDVEKIIKHGDKKLTEEEFVEKRYGISLNNLYRADIELENKSRDYKKAKTIAYLVAWEKYLNKAKPHLILNWDGCDLMKLTCDCVAKKCRKPILHTSGLGPISNTIYWDTDTMLNKWVKKDFLNKELIEAERKNVFDYLNMIKRAKPVIGGVHKETALLSLPKKFAYHLYNYIFMEKCNYPSNVPFGMVKSYLRTQIRQKLTMRYYSEPDFGEKYILLPLHVIDDAQIRVREYRFYRQDKLAELCAKNIPESYTLYVKAHPHGKGAIPVQWLKRMSLIPNVKLIAPDQNAHDLIINSQCIITVNSDVGWEALLYFKPVVVLAKPFYSGCGVTFDVNNIDELSRKIEEALDIKEIEPEKIYKLINAVMKSLHEGAFLQEHEFNQLNYEPHNIKKIADSILTELSKI